ncbi:hypothetical protein C7444_10713 [Sphaerotilus hippei]|uniref:Uncharacterized protein n=1 Tax=Sphaerotilus hippei TaxID=744406 RepID=A0A318HB40_9BURK|nr:hypothetical protein [Sphaerotilus hippei]PXW96107.1 hypothetical protein C7444_10713 [Sphaerotilus hippei]
MATGNPPGPLDFLSGDPVPVAPEHALTSPDAADRLPRAVVEDLMRHPGVDGVWIEHETSGERVVVIHYTPGGDLSRLPARVSGMPTRLVGGEPIVAL